MTTTSEPTLDLPFYESLDRAVLMERIQKVRAEMGPKLLKPRVTQLASVA